MVILEAKKGFRLDYEEEEPGSRLVGVVEGSEVYQELLGQYRRIKSRSTREYEIKIEDGEVKAVLQPDQINHFLASIMAIEENYRSLGKFVTRLVQNSYRLGNRKFKFNLGNSELDHLLTGFDVSDLEVELIGDIGSMCGYKLRRLVIFGNNFRDSTGMKSIASSFTGNNFRDYTGSNSKDSIFVGDTFGRWCGVESVGSIFRGNSFESLCGLTSRGSTFIGDFFGRASGMELEEGTFKTTNQTTFAQLCEDVQQKSGNSVVLLTPNGEEIRRYSNTW
jgi:hypothetical protein